MQEELITIPKREYEELKSLVLQLSSRVSQLEEKLKFKKNSSNSGIAPAKDENRNRSLRESRGRNSGGQKGHKGKTLDMSSTPDKVIESKPNFCSFCGSDVSANLMFLKEKRQKVVLPPI